MKARHILLGAAILLGCSDVTSSPFLAGTWDQEFTIPGNSLEFTLAVHGDAVSGTGHWTGEACCSGPVTVSGDAIGGEVHLSLTFTTDAGAMLPPRTSAFVGRLIDRQVLSGNFVNADGSLYPTTFRRPQ